MLPELRIVSVLSPALILSVWGQAVVINQVVRLS